MENWIVKKDTKKMHRKRNEIGRKKNGELDL